MKLSKKFAGALLLGLTMVTLAAAPASAKDLIVRGENGGSRYDINAAFGVNLYKEADEDCDPWLVDPVDSVITFGHLKYNADISKIKVSGRNKKKIEVFPRRVGTYYLKFKANKYILPGDEATVKFIVYQNKKAYNVKVDLFFQEKAYSPFTEVQLTHNVGGVRLDCGINAADFNSLHSVETDFGKNITAGKCWIFFRMNKAMDYKLKKIVLVKKDGSSRRIYNGTNHSLNNVKKIVVTVEHEPGKEYFGGYYKKENCAYKGCSKLLPVTETYTIIVK